MKKNLDEFVKYDKIRKKDTIVVHLSKNIRRRPDNEEKMAGYEYGNSHGIN